MCELLYAIEVICRDVQYKLAKRVLQDSYLDDDIGDETGIIQEQINSATASWPIGNVGCCADLWPSNRPGGGR